MFDILLQNLQLITMLILAFLGSLAINTLLGIYYNLSTLKEQFSREKLVTGLTRGGIILFSGLAITTVVSLLPEILKQFNITTETNLFENISTVAMAGILTSAIGHYLTDAFKKFYTILNSHTNITPEYDENMMDQ